MLLGSKRLKTENYRNCPLHWFCVCLCCMMLYNFCVRLYASVFDDVNMRVCVYVSFPGDDDLASLPYHLKDFLIINPN